MASTINIHFTVSLQLKARRDYFINQHLGLFTLICAVCLSPAYSLAFRFALVSKGLNNPFFAPAHDGCLVQAEFLTRTTEDDVECIYVGPPNDSDDESGALQAQLVSELLESGANIHGIAISVRNAALLTPLINAAVHKGIPVVTFDSDAPDSLRSAYIGTDNYFFGTQLAKLLNQFVPTGGTYAALGAISSPNLQQRMAGFHDEMRRKKGLWQELEGSPADTQANATLAMDQMYGFAAMNPTAIVPVMGMPMRSGLWKKFVDDNRERNITLVSGDAMPNQLEFLNRGYAQALVGQLPFEMGFQSIASLYALTQNQTIQDEIFGTNVLTHIQVPLVLPKLSIDNNLVGYFHAVGYILFALVAALAIGFAIWTYRSRNLHIVKVSQPSFLILVAVGMLVLASSLIPLSFDDGGEPSTQSEEEGTLICMSIPWLASTGFTISFSALFAKTLRVNRIFKTKTPFARVRVTARDVVIPLFALLSANTFILTLWTIMDPLIFIREDLPGMDGWNRVIATYGSCHSENVARFLVPLAFVNISILLLANWQAYEARSIESEFAESKYIGMAVASLLQALSCGIPILFVVRTSPLAFYLVMSFMVFVTCTAVLLLIFVPKMTLAYARTDGEQRNKILLSIRQQSFRRASLNTDGAAAADFNSSFVSLSSHTSQRLPLHSPSPVRPVFRSKSRQRLVDLEAASSCANCGYGSNLTLNPPLTATAFPHHIPELSNENVSESCTSYAEIIFTSEKSEQKISDSDSDGQKESSSTKYFDAFPSSENEIIPMTSEFSLRDSNVESSITSASLLSVLARLSSHEANLDTSKPCAICSFLFEKEVARRRKKHSSMSDHTPERMIMRSLTS